jgi:hypothetical protein
MPDEKAVRYWARDNRHGFGQPYIGAGKIG